MEQNRIAITGIGVYTALGNNPKGFWEALVAGKSGAGPITAFDTTGYKCRIAAEIKDFDPKQYLSGKRVRRMARFSQMAAAAARQAVANAGLDLENLPDNRPDRVGAVIGTAAGDYVNMEEQHRNLLELLIRPDGLE